jgi:ubiquitin-protein ligase
MVHNATQVILQNLRNIKQHPVPGCQVTQDSEDPFVVRVIFNDALEDTPYAGTNVTMLVIMSETFPVSKPKLKFEKPIYHINIDQKSFEVCMPLLRSWDSELTIRDIIGPVAKLLKNPDESSATDHKILTEYNENRALFNDTARKIACQ